VKALARCRWCDRNDVPIEKMAIYSFKRSFGGFTGVCKACIGSESAEAAYHARVAERMSRLTSAATR
jgi:hypothetical protein